MDQKTSLPRKKTGGICVRSQARLPAWETDPSLGGDWNFELEEFPIDLVHGANVQRPISDERATSPVLRGAGKSNATGLEEATDFKSNHRVIRMPLAGENLTSFRGQPDYEEPQETDGITVANRYLDRDVATLWPL
eukprot:3074951-Amphidinium_carterae.1